MYGGKNQYNCNNWKEYFEITLKAWYNFAIIDSYRAGQHERKIYYI